MRRPARSSSPSLPAPLTPLAPRYVRRIFSHELEPKRVRGRALTAPELKEFIATYAALFKDGARFPEARTMLAATAEANNRNAASLAAAAYKEAVDKVVSPRNGTYVAVAVFDALHAASAAAAVEVFAKRASMGSKSSIAAFKADLETDLDDLGARYRELNAGRNPLKDVEFYVLPLAAAFASYLISWILNTTCSKTSYYCANASEAFSQMFAFIFAFFLIMSAGYLKKVSAYMRGVLNLGSAVAKEKMA